MPVKTKSPRKPNFETWAIDAVARLSGQLNLQEWRIGLNFDIEDENPDCTAFACINGRYRTAYISFTPNAREMWDDNRMQSLTECITHEVTHLLLDPLHKFAKQAASSQTESYLTDILEQTNQRLARIVIEQLPPKFFSR